MKPAELADQIRAQIAQAVVGQDKAVTELLICFFSGGHALLEGVPGVAKTLLAKTLATVLGLRFKRIQFTPDLMPSDVTGTNVFDMATSQFSLRKGPIFTDVLLADEINRTPAKTQAALLEAMEERTVTIDGDTQSLPEYFFVTATQNPIEYEGTYPLPEAQLDRFMMKIAVGYPAEAEEIGVLTRAHEGFDPHRLQASGIQQIAQPELLHSVREECRKVTAQESLLKYVADIVRATRESSLLSLGASPRAGVAALMTAKTCAALEGRDYLLPDDVQQVAHPVLRHRLLLRPDAMIEGLNTDAVVDQILSDVPVPR
ncbi:MAG: MoxR family ATPase [Armatimonadetes bacterium]|nr:MoxR family ATPase [Armatimonadota bacterium]